MEHNILGLHHITAIAGNAKRNYDFYTNVLGLRLVKKTVNFDDPGTYHFYYGDEVGTPGTILTFFPWDGVRRGYTGNGMATEIGYSVPKDSLDFWKERFKEFKVQQGEITERFGEKTLPFQDPDGLLLNLIEPKNTDVRKPWTAGGVGDKEASRGFHSIVLSLAQMKGTVSILTDIFGYHLVSQEGNRYRFATDSIAEANIVDIIENPAGKPGLVAGGTNHHVAFRVKNDEAHRAMREKIASRGYGITERIDRNYFWSLYFREPGGVLFEIATDNPGFTIDEPVSELGKALKLPAQYEGRRREIEGVLPELV